MSKLDLLLEAERRGILPADKQPLLDEARRRGLVPNDRPSEPWPNRMARQVSSAVPGADRIKAVGGAGIDYLSGESGTFGDLYDRRLKREQALTNEANSSMGAGDVLAKTAGYTISGLGMMRIPLLASQLPANPQLPQVAMEGARIGAPVGALQAYADSPADTGSRRLADTAAGFVGGGTFGAALPYVLAAPGAASRMVQAGVDRLTGTTPANRMVMSQASKEFEVAGIPRENLLGPALRPEGSRTAESLAASLAGGPVRDAAARNAQLLEQSLARELQATGAQQGREAGAEAQELLRRQLTERTVPQSRLETMPRADLDRLDSRNNPWGPESFYTDAPGPGYQGVGREVATRNRYDAVFREPLTYDNAFRPSSRGYSYGDEFGAAYEGLYREVGETVRAPVAIAGTRARSGQPNQVYGLLEELRGDLRSSGLLRGDDPAASIFRSPAAEKFRKELSRRMPPDVVEAIYSHTPLALRDLRRIRTTVREAADVPAAQNRFDSAFLERMEGALTGDMMRMLDRSPDLRMSAARMRRHDDAYRAFQSDLVAPLRRVFGDNVTPEQAIARLVDAAGRGRSSDLQMLRAYYRVHADKGDVRQATAGIIGHMAQDGLQGFLAGMRNLSPTARRLMFTGRAERLGEAIARFERVAERLEPYQRIGRNPGIDASRLPNVIVGGSLLSSLWAGIATFAGQHGLARFMSSPRYVRWLTRAAQADPRDRGAWRQHMARLSALAEGDADLGQAIVQGVGSVLRPEQASAAPFDNAPLRESAPEVPVRTQRELREMSNEELFEYYIRHSLQNLQNGGTYESDPNAHNEIFRRRFRSKEMTPQEHEAWERDWRRRVMPHEVDENGNLRPGAGKRAIDKLRRHREGEPEPSNPRGRRDGQPMSSLQLMRFGLEGMRNAPGEWLTPHVNPGLEIRPGDPRGRGVIEWPAEDELDGDALISNGVVDPSTVAPMLEEALRARRDARLRPNVSRLARSLALLN